MGYLSLVFTLFSIFCLVCTPVLLYFCLLVCLFFLFCFFVLFCFLFLFLFCFCLFCSCVGLLVVEKLFIYYMISDDHAFHLGL